MAKQRYGRLKLGIAGLSAIGILGGAAVLQPGSGASAADDLSALVQNVTQPQANNAAPSASTGGATAAPQAASTVAPASPGSTKSTSRSVPKARVSRGS